MHRDKERICSDQGFRPCVHVSVCWVEDWAHWWTLAMLNLFQDNVRYRDSKIRGVNMGPTWGRQDPGGPHVGPMNLAIWVYIYLLFLSFVKTERANVFKNWSWQKTMAHLSDLVSDMVADGLMTKGVRTSVTLLWKKFVRSIPASALSYQCEFWSAGHPLYLN